jgi:hypothetical protein
MPWKYMPPFRLALSSFHLYNVEDCHWSLCTCG